MPKAALIAFLAIVLMPLFATAQGGEDLVSGKLLRFGMLQQDALDLVTDSDDWQIAYRITTPSTLDLACRHKETMFYQARFFQGRCYYIETRFEAELADVETVFVHYRERLGESPEATQSRDARLMFARWNTKVRDLSLTAYRRDSGLYVLTYEEFTPETVGIARYTQEKELDSVPTEIDPVTGQPRVIHTIPQDEAQKGEGDGAGKTEDPDDTADPDDDTKKKEKPKRRPPQDDPWEEP